MNREIRPLFARIMGQARRGREGRQRGKRNLGVRIFAWKDCAKRWNKEAKESNQQKPKRFTKESFAWLIRKNPDANCLRLWILPLVGPFMGNAWFSQESPETMSNFACGILSGASFRQLFLKGCNFSLSERDPLAST